MTDTGTGIRKSLLKANGRRRGLQNLYDSPRFDSGRQSRSYKHRTQKDDKAFRPWRKGRVMAKLETLIERNCSDPEFVRTLLEAQYVTKGRKHDHE